MVMPVLAAAAGSGLLGSVISGVGSLFGGKKSKEAADNAAMANYLAQKEFAQNGIRWKVEDAKAAGLHPLFALGGSGATFSPSFTVSGEGAGIADAGQHLGRAASAFAQSSEKRLLDAQLVAAEAAAKKDFAQAEYWASEAARNRQQNLPSVPGPGPLNLTTWIDGQMVEDRQAGVEVRPLAASVPYHAANLGGSEPMWKTYTIEAGHGRDAFQIDLPAGSSPSESLESVSESKALMAAILARNLQVYGDGWRDKAARAFGW